MLLSGTDPIFNKTVEDVYGSIKPRLVDTAMQKARFTMIAETGYDDKESCESTAFGTQYIDDLCLNLYD